MRWAPSGRVNESGLIHDSKSERTVGKPSARLEPEAHEVGAAWAAEVDDVLLRLNKLLSGRFYGRT